MINLCVDLVFITDLFLNFRTPYRDAQTGRIVRDGRQIAAKYAQTWFPLDFVSVMPFEYLGFMQSETTSAESQANLTQLRLLRFLRLARLLKLLRVLRASRKLKQWQVYINLRFATLQLVQV